MNSAYQEVQKLLAQIRVASSNPIIERCSDQLEVICRAHLEIFEHFLPDIHFTPAERRMLDLMHSRLGRTVNRGALLDVIEVMGKGPPSPKSIDVLIFRIRAKFRNHNVPYHVETDHSIGFRLLEGAGPVIAGRSTPRSYMMAA